MAARGQEFLSNERIGRLGAVLYLASAVVTLASPALPAPPEMDRRGVLLVGAIGLVLGTVFLFLPWGRWPRSASLWLAAVPAQALIGLHNYVGGSDPYRYGLFFMVCYAWIGLAQPRWSTLKLVPFTAAAYFVPLLLRDTPAWAPASAIYALPIFVLSGEATAWVSAQLRRANDALAQQASHDPLTGLANRSALADRAADALARAERDGTCVALLYVDMDRFKQVNDELGHETGDAALCVVAQRLRAAVRGHDTVARLGGDEFAVLAEDVAGVAEAHALAARVVEVAREPIEIDGHAVRLPVSVGVTVCHEGGTTLDTLLRDGDAAMYRAKSAGGDGLHRFDADAA